MKHISLILLYFIEMTSHRLQKANQRHNIYCLFKYNRAKQKVKHQVIEAEEKIKKR